MNMHDDDKEYGRTPDLNNDVPGKRKNPKRRACAFCTDLAKAIDYKDAQSLKYFISERGKIVPRRMSGNCAWHQRKVTVAIKQARNIALLPFTTNG